MRLVEICVDGRLEATMYATQAQLADAYITAGSAAEARFIAEDLVAREPWDRANIERFRRALTLSGELDPDTIIAERLSGESPFMSTDLTFSEELPNLEPEPVAVELPPAVEVAADRGSEAQVSEPETDVSAEPAEATSPQKSTPKSKSKTKTKSEPVAVESLTDGDGEDVELNIDLDELQAATPSRDLDSVFARLRSDLSRRPGESTTDEQFKSGVAHYEAGRFDEALSDLEAASASPRLRFAAASLVGRIYQKRAMSPKAITWFERAAEAPPTNVEEGRGLLYDLAEALESTGEATRALAIYLELHAEAGDYRDVSARVDRLGKVQTRG
jgi:tetratricopeptide (TPR) repeat protein